MDHYDQYSSPQQQRKLQGPRPAPLKVRKESHKIQKPPIVRQPPATQSSCMKQQPPSPPPPPVIIYAVSPKVIHTSPRNFMDVVQKLTGPDSNHSPPLAASSSTLSCPTGRILESGQAVALPPAARFSAIGNTTVVPFNDNDDDYHHLYGSCDHVDQTQIGLVDGHATAETTVAGGFISSSSSGSAAYGADRLSGLSHNYTFLPQHLLHQDNLFSEILPNNQQAIGKTITNSPSASLSAISPHNLEMARLPHPP